MSSMYPFGGAAARSCMRCGTPLAMNESQCSRCGTYNPPPQFQYPQNLHNAQGEMPQGQQFSTLQQGSGQGTSGPLWGAQSQFQQTGNSAWPGASGNAWGSPGQADGWPQNSLFADQGQQPSQPLQQNLFGAPPGNSFLGPNQSSLNNTFGGFQQNPAHSANGSFFNAPRQNGYTKPAPWATLNNPQARPAWAKKGDDDDDEDTGKKGPGAGVVIVIVVLLVALIGGGAFAGYKIFKSRTATTNTTTGPTIVTPSVTPLFHDAFQNNGANWDLTAPTGAKITLSGGKMVLEADNNKLYQEPFPGGKTYGDFRLDVDAGLTGGDAKNGYGVYVRGASAQNDPLGLFYRFEVYGDGYFYIYKGSLDANGNLQVQSIAQSQQPSNAVNLKGQMNHLTIIAQGPKLTWIINGTTVATITDNSYKSGTMALFVSNVANVQPGAIATFQNLAVFPAQ